MCSLIEEFTIDEHTYIVTKFYKKGDLVSFMEELGIDSYSEEEVKALVH